MEIKWEVIESENYEPYIDQLKLVYEESKNVRIYWHPSEGTLFKCDHSFGRWFRGI